MRARGHQDSRPGACPDTRVGEAGSTGGPGGTGIPPDEEVRTRVITRRARPSSSNAGSLPRGEPRVLAPAPHHPATAAREERIDYRSKIEGELTCGDPPAGTGPGHAPRGAGRMRRPTATRAISGANLRRWALMRLDDASRGFFRRVRRSGARKDRVGRNFKVRHGRKGVSD